MKEQAESASGKDFKANCRSLGKALEDARKVLITTHVNPDGDAIGSSLGLMHYLEMTGKEARVMTPNNFPAFLKWLPAADRIVHFDSQREEAEQLIRQADHIICLDFNDRKRMGKAASSILKSAAGKVLIDHHPDPEDFTDIILSDTSVSSTAELLYEILAEINPGLQISREVSVCLYTGIMTDTGCFSFNSSRPRTFRVVAELLARDFDKDHVYRQVYDTFSESRMRLLGYCLDRKMEVFPEYRTAIITLSMEEQERFRFEIGDSEGFVNYPLSIAGIVFSVLFMEKNGYTKISFRSRGTFEVNTLARLHFHGGGHLNAAGGELQTSLDRAVEKLKNLLPSYKEALHHAIEF